LRPKPARGGEDTTQGSESYGQQKPAPNHLDLHLPGFVAEKHAETGGWP
jgi:hypothetical protein